LTRQREVGTLAHWSHWAFAGIEPVVVVLIAGMPSAVLAAIFTSETCLDEDLAVSVVALSICLGVAILPWSPELTMILIG